MTGHRMTLLLASALLLTACGRDSQEEPGGATEDTAAVGAQDTTGRMQGMPGMQGNLMDEMGAHMREMEGLSADSLRGMMPMHSQMARNALAEMERQMRGMNMTPDAQWNATADSVRQDLTRLPEMSSAELEAAMPAHQARMRRLMDMHRTMMPPAPM